MKVMQTTNTNKPFSLLFKLMLVVPLALVVAFILITEAEPGAGSKATSGSVSAQEYKKTLAGQVDTADGQPRTGRDPSSQQQSSLSQAASSPSGNGFSTDKPAAGVTTDHSQHNHGAQPSNVYGDPKASGINSAGCFIDYGIQGQQCISAAVAGDDRVLTCDEVRTIFAEGVKVSGEDRFHLDTNHDGTACGFAD